MKKTNFLKTLLIAVAAMGGVNCAWGEDTPYNISSTESSYVDATDDASKAATHNGSSLDDLIAYNVQVRNWQAANNSCNAKFNSGGKMAIYKFPLASVKSETSFLKSATVKVTINSTGDNKNVTTLGVFGYNGSQDWTGATLTYNTLSNNGANDIGYTVNYSGSFPILDENRQDLSGGASSVISVSALTYVQSALDADRDYISFAVSNNSTRVTNLNVVATLELVYTSEAPFSYTVNAVDDKSNILKTYADNVTGYVGNTYTVYYNKCVEKDGVWYETTTKNVEPYLGVDVTAAGTTNIEYNANGASYFYEFENLSTARSNGSGGTGDGNAPRRYSNGSAKRLYQYTRAYTPALAGGVYTIRLKAHNISSSTEQNATLYLSDASGNINGEQIATFAESWSKATLSEKSISDIVIPNGSSLAIYNNSASNSNLCIDYFILTRDEIKSAIADCKAYDTSAAFATAIDAESFTTVEEVYAFNTTYHIANGVLTDGVRDITGVIRNAAVADATDWGGATINSGEEFTGAPDNTYLDNYNASINTNQTVYGVPAGTYIVKAATRAAAGTPGTLYVSDGTSDVGKIDQITNVGNTGGDLGNGWSYQEMTFTLTDTKNLLIGFWANTADSKWAGCDDWHMYKVESVPAAITSAGMATYVPAYDLDFSATEIEAYKVKVSTKGVATLTKVDEVPAGTPVLLVKDGGATEDIPVMTGAAAVSDNDLVAGTGAAVATVDGEYTNMILNDGSKGIGFYFAAGQTVATNRAYLHIATTLAPDVAGSRMEIVFEDVVTGIENNNRETITNNRYYNLHGVEVAQPTKGLYIVNGKKVVVK